MQLSAASTQLGRALAEVKELEGKLADQVKELEPLEGLKQQVPNMKREVDRLNDQVCICACVCVCVMCSTRVAMNVLGAVRESEATNRSSHQRE